MKISAVLKAEIRSAADIYTDPCGNKLLVIHLSSIGAISSRMNITQLMVETASLAMGVVPARYVRNLGTLGIKGQLKLLRSCVAIAGAGGLGGIIIELLARAGAGRIIVIDNGRFTENNLNRQMLALEENTGKSKARAAAQRIKQVNSSIEVTAYNKRLTPENAESLIAGADVAIDALDNLPSRYVLAEGCRKLGIPLIHGAIAGFSGQVLTIMPGDRGLDALYGPLERSSVCGIESITGNPPTTPAITGALEAQEAIKIITGVGKNIRGSLRMFDLSDNTADEVSF